MIKEMKDIDSIEEVNKICKQPDAMPKDKVICMDCPLFYCSFC